jgi:nucleotide-binding universal stress UspA family protein
MVRPVAPHSVETLVVPVDGSEPARAGALAASGFAARLNAGVHLLSAVATHDEVDARRDGLARLGVPSDRLTTEVVVDVQPALALSEAMRRLPGAVACVSTHGRGCSAALLGSVATEVVARSRKPLVLVCPFVDRAVDGRGVMACVDDGPAAPLLVALAAGWAELLGEPLRVVSVAEAAAGSGARGRAGRRFGPDGDVDAFLDGLVGPLRAAGRAVETRALYDPVGAASGIGTHLRDAPATLVVAGGREHPGLARLVFGQVSGALVRHSPSPVLVIPGITAP